MPLFGAHFSIAGGLHNALVAARAHECQACQLFTANPQSWSVPIPSVKQAAQPRRSKTITDEATAQFATTLRETGVRITLAHDSYLINLASPDPVLYRRSVEAFTAEVERAEQLGLTYLVTHPGAHVGCGEEAGLARVSEALDEVHSRCPGYRVRILLETTAGQGTCLGGRFEHVAAILERVALPDRLGVCLDTCHVFAAGYPLAPVKAYRATLRAFDRVIGLERLLAFHLNDSQKPQGSRVDRHAHIGRGCLGLEPFRLLVNDRRFRNRPMILETPKEEGEEKDMDTVNLRTLRELST
jgi:deoxyribonuclease-4